MSAYCQYSSALFYSSYSIDHHQAYFIQHDRTTDLHAHNSIAQKTRCRALCNARNSESDKNLHPSCFHFQRSVTRFFSCHKEEEDGQPFCNCISGTSLLESRLREVEAEARTLAQRRDSLREGCQTLWAGVTARVVLHPCCPLSKQSHIRAVL
jgi:hypothetical protein